MEIINNSLYQVSEKAANIRYHNINHKGGFRPFVAFEWSSTHILFIPISSSTNDLDDDTWMRFAYTKGGKSYKRYLMTSLPTILSKKVVEHLSTTKALNNTRNKIYSMNVDKVLSESQIGILNYHLNRKIFY